MDEQHVNEGLVGAGGNQSKGSSQALRQVEQEWRREHCGHKGHGTKDDLHAASSQGEKIVS